VSDLRPALQVSRHANDLLFELTDAVCIPDAAAVAYFKAHVSSWKSSALTTCMSDGNPYAEGLYVLFIFPKLELLDGKTFWKSRVNRGA
jgi:hypothetical protein